MRTLKSRVFKRVQSAVRGHGSRGTDTARAPRRRLAQSHVSHTHPRGEEQNGVLNVDLYFLVHDSRAETIQLQLVHGARSLKIVSLRDRSGGRSALSATSAWPGVASAVVVLVHTVSRVDRQSALFHGYFPCR